jgi:phosphate transport system protein
MTQQEHTSTQFDKELGELHGLVTQMGILVESQVRDVIRILDAANAELVESVIANDHRVNALEVMIDEECDRIVVLRQPAAVDMRTVMAIVKIVTDLERVGDEAKNIAHIVQRHRLPSAAMLPYEIRRSAENALAMLHRSLDNCARQDLEAALQVIRASHMSGSDYGMIVRPLVMEMMEQPASIAAGLDAMFISKAIDRIAEHAINISEHVVYLVKGKDVRHIPLSEIERKLSEQ